MKTHNQPTNQPTKHTTNQPTTQPTQPNKEGGESACSPTFFHLKDDGTLLLARGSSPSKPYATLWASKTPQQKKPSCKKCGGAACACQRGQKQRYEAVYTEKGWLEVRREGDGQAVWKKRPFFQPKALRPWPLTK